MTAPVMPARHSARRRSIVSRVLLAVAFMVPVTILFVQVWQTDSDKIAATSTEQQGLRYLAALQPVINAICDVESIAVGGNKVSFSVVDPAVAAASVVDEQIGTTLQTGVLWNNIRVQIANAHNATLSASAAVGTFSQINSLLLQLSDKIRLVSGLARDPDADTNFLADAAGHQLPASVIAAGQYGDYIVIGLPSTGINQAADNADIISARTALIAAADNLGNDVQSAVDATASRNLSVNLLAKLNDYRLSIDGLTPSNTPVAGHTSAQDNAQAAADKAAVGQAANALNVAMFAAIDGLLDTRIDTVSGQRWPVAATGLLAVVVALLPLLLLAARRSARAPRPAAPERAVDVDTGSPGRSGGYAADASLRGRRYVGDDRMPGRGEPLPSRLGAQHRPWPEAAPEREGWERTGVPR